MPVYILVAGDIDNPVAVKIGWQLRPDMYRAPASASAA